MFVGCMATLHYMFAWPHSSCEISLRNYSPCDHCFIRRYIHACRAVLCAAATMIATAALACIVVVTLWSAHLHHGVGYFSIRCRLPLSPPCYMTGCACVMSGVHPLRMGICSLTSPSAGCIFTAQLSIFSPTRHILWVSVILLSPLFHGGSHPVCIRSCPAIRRWCWCTPCHVSIHGVCHTLCILCLD